MLFLFSTSMVEKDGGSGEKGKESNERKQPSSQWGGDAKRTEQLPKGRGD